MRSRPKISICVELMVFIIVEVINFPLGNFGGFAFLTAVYSFVSRGTCRSCDAIYVFRKHHTTNATNIAINLTNLTNLIIKQVSYFGDLRYYIYKLNLS